MYVDLDIIYALIKRVDRHAAIAERILSRKEKKYTSIVTLLELEIVLKREISNFLSKNAQKLFREKFPELRVISLNQKLFKKSLELRRKFDLGVFDSIHAATALSLDKRIASTDKIYNRIPSLRLIEG